MTTTETREVFAAVTALVLRYKDAMTDGKLSWYEMAGFLAEVRPVRRAIERIHEVPSELIDLSPEEMPALTADISNILAAWGISHRSQDITRLVVSRMPALLDLVQALLGELRLLMSEIEAQPPSALPA